MKSSIKYIKYFLLFYFAIRLVGITNPPLETNHNWRQVTGLMVSRNFLEVDPNILYPRVDETNGGTGIIGMEFPTLNYACYVVSEGLGYKHWYGRLINLIISTLGIFFFFKTLVLAGIKDRTALASTIVLASSIWFTFSRKMMPDTYCISIMFMGIYMGLRYLQYSKPRDLVAYVAITTLAVLSKIPAGIYFIILIPFLIAKENSKTNRMKLATATFIPVVSTFVWYFKWNPYLSSEYGSWYNSGKSLSKGLSELTSNIPNVLDNFYFDSFHSYIFIAIFIVGLVMSFIKNEKKIYIPFLLVASMFAVYMMKSGHYFYNHNYYIIPFVPVMALVAGFALGQIKKQQIFIALLAIGSVEAIANQQHDFFIKESQEYKMTLEQILDDFSSRDDLIAVNGNGNPQLIYLSHRKGWNFSNEQLSNSEFIESVAEKGCKYFVIDKTSFEGESYLPHTMIYEDDNFIIYSN